MKRAEKQWFKCQVCGDGFGRTKQQLNGRKPVICGAYACRQALGRLHAQKRYAQPATA